MVHRQIVANIPLGLGLDTHTQGTASKDTGLTAVSAACVHRARTEVVEMQYVVAIDRICALHLYVTYEVGHQLAFGP